MSKIRVTYDEKSGRFLMACPFYLNSLPKSLPNRKWDGKRNYWTAPAIRANVEHMVAKFTKSITDFTAEARAALDAAVERYKQMEGGMHRPKESFPAWYPFKTKPRAKQLEGLNKIFGLKSVALFMDMRTGKTKVVIDYASALRMKGDLDGVLIICPLSIRKNWVREIEIHAPFPIDAHLLDTGNPKEYDKWLAKPHDFKWLIVGVESFAQGSAVEYAKRFLLAGTKRLTAVDESSKIKTPGKTRSERVVSLRTMSEYRLTMTGTPIANGVLDLFMQFEFLDPEIIGLGDFYSFRNRYAIMGGFQDKRIIGYQNLEELTEMIEPFIYQVRKTEVFPDAPSKIYQQREVQLTTEQRRLYVQMKKELRVITDDKSLIVQNVLEKMLRLQEITGGIVSYLNPNYNPNHDPECQKLDAPKLRCNCTFRQRKGVDKFFREYIAGTNPKFEELLAVVEENDGPTIIWCAYVEEIKLVVQGLRERYGADQVVELHGGVTEEDRDVNVNVKFQGGQARFLVGNTATGGMGLTMSAAEIEIYYSNTFNYIDREQSEERAFGPHKKNGTLIFDIIAEGTVDGHILKALEQKKDVSEYIRGSIDDLKDRIYGDLG